MHASLNVGYQGKSGPGKIHEVILVVSMSFVPKNRNDFNIYLEMMNLVLLVSDQRLRAVEKKISYNNKL